MERKDATIGDVIKVVDAASERELKELVKIRKAVEGLDKAVVPKEGDPRSVARNRQKLSVNQAPQKTDVAPQVVDEIAMAMKKHNLGQSPRANNKSNYQEQSKGSPSSTRPKSAHKKTEEQAVQAEAVVKARAVYQRKAVGQNAEAPASPERTRDARGRFVGKSGSKAASDEAKAERAEKMRQRDEEDERNDRESFLKRLGKAIGDSGNPAETTAVDALGYAAGGPLWVVGKELGNLTKEVGGTVNNTRKSMTEVFRDNKDKKSRRGLFGRRPKNSADVVQLNTQRQALQEQEEQTEAIKDGNQQIIKRLDKIAGNTGKSGGGIFSKLFSLLGKGGKLLPALLGGLFGDRLLGKVFGRSVGRGAAVAGGFALNKITRALFGGNIGAGEALASAGGSVAAESAGRLGAKAIGKVLLRAIPFVGALAGGIYDAITGWNDIDAQRRAFGLKDGEELSLQQKIAYTLANILDMGGLVSGISNALGSVLKSMGFDALGSALKSFSTENLARSINEGMASFESYFSGLGDKISATFNDYTTRIGETVSGWFREIKDDITKKLNDVVNFFTVDNLKHVFKDAIGAAIDFVKNPVDHIKNGVNNAIDGAKEKISEGWQIFKDKAGNPDTYKAGFMPVVHLANKVLSAATAEAQNATQVASETVGTIASSSAFRVASEGAQNLENSIGEASTPTGNVARGGSVSIIGTGRNDIQKAADAYNNGNLDVKMNGIDNIGANNLKSMDSYFRQLEQKYGLPEGLLYSIAATESGGRTNAMSQTGALGMFQFTSIARKDVGMTERDAWDPYKSAEGAAKLLSKYIKQAKGDWNEAITAYNAGFGTINRWKKGEKDLSKENKEYAIKVNTHRANYLGGAAFTPGTGSNAGNVSSHTALPVNAKIDESTGLAFTPGENPFEKGGVVDRFGEMFGVNELAEKFLSSPGMQHQVVQGTLEERAYGKGTKTNRGNIVTAQDLQMPISRMQLDGRTISDLGGSGVKPTMQLADNTVSMDGETRRLFKRMVEVLDKIEGHTKESAKKEGPVIKVGSPQPGVMSSVPLSIDDSLMNDYARVD